MTYWVAREVDEDPDQMLPHEAWMVKLYVNRAREADRPLGTQMVGAYGYSFEDDMERLVRASLVSYHLRQHLPDPARHHREDAGR